MLLSPSSVAVAGVNDDDEADDEYEYEAEATAKAEEPHKGESIVSGNLYDLRHIHLMRKTAHLFEF